MTDAGSNDVGIPNLVSAIVPVYNGARFLAEAIQSILDQTYEPIEIIVVDDGSTDGSGDIAREFSIVTVLRQENLGVSSARNLGIERASGEFIAFLDADDDWTSEKTALQEKYLRNNPACHYVLSHYQNYFPMGIPTWFRPTLVNEPVAEPSPGGLLCRSSLFQVAGLFDPEYRQGEDTEWFGRLRDLGLNAYTLPEVLMHRRVHDANLSGNIEAGQQSLLRSLRASVRRKREEGPKRSSQ